MGLSPLIQYATRTSFSNPRSGMVTVSNPLPERMHGQSIHPWGLSGSFPVWPTSSPETSLASGHTNGELLSVCSPAPDM